MLNVDWLMFVALEWKPPSQAFVQQVLPLQVVLLPISSTIYTTKRVDPFVLLPCRHLVFLLVVIGHPSHSHFSEALHSQPTTSPAMPTSNTISKIQSWLLLAMILASSWCNGFVTPPMHSIRPNRRAFARNMADPNDSNIEPIDVTLDDRLYRVRLSRATGIEWGSDLSFSFVYVRDLDPTGAAAQSKANIQINNQLCELQAVVDENDETTTKTVHNLIGAPFDTVMRVFAQLPATVREVDLVLFRGTKNDLKALCTGQASAGDAETIAVTVVQNKGTADERTTVLTAPVGVNVRQLLVDNNINVYQSVTRWTNCKGKQLCGTCIVNVTEGASFTNRKSMDEASTLRENEDSYRLSCITFAYGDVTVETFPPIQAAQWTR